MTASDGAVKSADRTLSILECLASSNRRRSLGELSAELGIPKSSLHGLLRTLRVRGWVSTDETGQRFGLGVRALLVGTSFTATDDMVRVSADVLDELAATIEETVHLGRLDGDMIVYLAKREATHPLRLFSAIGVRIPAATTALGKALLADRPTGDVESLLPSEWPALTPATLTTRDALIDQLEDIRAAGYAVDREESTPGVRCFAVTVGPGRPADYAISCSVPTVRLDPERERAVIAGLQSAQRVLADRHGLTKPH
jgi:DNA-binding IclR family transcriptional regulator